MYWQVSSLELLEHFQYPWTDVLGSVSPSFVFFLNVRIKSNLSSGRLNIAESSRLAWVIVSDNLESYDVAVAGNRPQTKEIELLIDTGAVAG